MIDARSAYAQLLFPASVVGAIALAIAAVVLLPSAVHAQPPPAWRWPLPGDPEVVRGFDPPDQPWGAGHRGVDLGAYAGEPVYAAGAGRIGYVGRIAGRGIVTIVHGDRRTTYLPVRASVHTGDRVKAGARIGAVEPGFAHCPARVCLHWGLIRGETYLDPLSLIPRSPIRLLPFNSPGFNIPAFNGPAFNGPAFNTPGFSRPGLNGPGLGFPLLAASAVGGPTRHAPAPRTKPVSELARSALAGTGGAGVVLLVLAASGRATRRRQRPPGPGEAQRATAMRYHPAGGRRFPPSSRTTTSPENPQVPQPTSNQPPEKDTKPTRPNDHPTQSNDQPNRAGDHPNRAGGQQDPDSDHPNRAGDQSAPDTDQPNRAGDQPDSDRDQTGPNGDQGTPGSSQPDPNSGEAGSSGEGTSDEGRRTPGVPLLTAIRPLPSGRHRKAHRLRHLAARLCRRPTATPAPPPPEPTYAKIIDLDTERRARRPTTPDDPDPA